MPLRTAECRDHFILSGGEDVFEPRFTCHGFQYVEIENYPGDISLDDIVAEEIYTDLDVETYAGGQPVYDYIISVE